MAAFQNMPSTRAQSRSRVPARAGATEVADERAGPVENSISADAQVDNQGNRANMSDLPNKLDDPSIILKSH